jgi:hypothetical protein
MGKVLSQEKDVTRKKLVAERRAESQPKPIVEVQFV